MKALPAQPEWSDLQRLMTRWGAYGHYEGACTPERCNYRIIATTPPPSWTERAPGLPLRLLEPGALLAKLLHVNAGDLWVSLTERRGRLISYRIESSSAGPDVAIAAVAMTYRLKLTHDAWTSNQPLGDAGLVSTVSASAQLAQHPDYLVARGACTGCLIDEVDFTPYVDPADKARFLDFNVACLGGIGRVCKTPGDLLPAFRETDADTEKWHEHVDAVYAATGKYPHEDDTDDCLASARVLGRDLDYVLAVEPFGRVVRRGTEAPNEGKDVTLTQLRVLAVLKAYPAHDPSFIDPKPGDTLLVEGEFPLGKDLLIFSPGALFGEFGRIETRDCGRIPDTPQTRQEALQGAAEDFPY